MVDATNLVQGVVDGLFSFALLVGRIPRCDRVLDREEIPPFGLPPYGRL